MTWKKYPSEAKSSRGIIFHTTAHASTAIQMMLTTTSNPFPGFSYLKLQHPSRLLSQNAPVAECMPRFPIAGGLRFSGGDDDGGGDGEAVWRKKRIFPTD